MGTRLFIGTYTSGDSKGIYQATWQDEALTLTGCTQAVNPSYIAVHENRLYAVRETRGGGAVSYRVEPDGTLTLTGEQPVSGDAPCHLCVIGNRLYVSNYASGSLSIFRLAGDGAIASPPHVIAHDGKSAHVTRQSSAHVHQAQSTPDGKYLAVCDLGADAVFFYPLDADGIHAPAHTHAPAGSGPRHAVFGPGGRWYVLCELSCELLVYQGYGDDAILLKRCPMLRDGDPESACAALRLSPDGTLLLASTRGANTLALWDVSADGALSDARWFSAHGDWPRDAAFTPDGRYVLCACEKEDQITTFAVRSGNLVFMHSTAIPMPTCVCFCPVGACG